MSRAVYKGSLHINNIAIPLAIYKTQDSYGITANRFHTDCNGAIKMKMYCEDHPDEESPSWFSGVAVNGEVVAVTDEVRDSLLGRKTPFTFVGAYPLKDLAFGTKYFPVETYTVARVQTNPPLPNDFLHTLFETIRRRKTFLLCKIGLSGMERYAILLPNAKLITLSYNEEIRSHDAIAGTFDKNLASFLQDEFESSPEFPELTCAAHIERVNKWFTSKIVKRIAARTNPKKRAPTKVPVG